MNYVEISTCPNCCAELEPGVPHDPEICAAAARMIAAASAHRNFGKERRVPSVTRSAASTGTSAPAEERGPVGIERSLPPEREFHAAAEENYGPTIGSSEAEFHGSVNVSAALNVLLEHLRAHFGEWIPMVELERLMDVKRANSRVAEARALIQDDEDIDQENRLYEPTGKLHSFYRLCLKSDSVRLKRKQEKEHGQQEFQA